MRLAQADRFVEVALMVLDASHDDSIPGVAGALASVVIAAADAARCAKLHRRSRGHSYTAAATSRIPIRPHGPAMAKDLRRLIQRKDEVHYASEFMTTKLVKDMVTWPKRLAAEREARARSMTFIYCLLPTVDAEGVAERGQDFGGCFVNRSTFRQGTSRNSLLTGKRMN